MLPHILQCIRQPPFLLFLSCYITNYHRLGGLSSRHLFLIVLKGRKSKIKVLADLVPCESLFPGLQIVAFLLWTRGHS